MPEEEYEIRGAHEEAVEEGAHHHNPLSQRIALFSAVLATLGAIVSFLGGHTQNDALYYKNEAVLMKARASDDWAYYQAEDIKRHLAESVAAMAPERANAADIARYRQRAASLKAEAEAFDRRSEEADAESRHALSPHTKLALAMTFVQVAIALASITALTRRRWLLWGAGASAIVGVTLSVVAWF